MIYGTPSNQLYHQMTLHSSSFSPPHPDDGPRVLAELSARQAKLLSPWLETSRQPPRARRPRKILARAGFIGGVCDVPPDRSVMRCVPEELGSKSDPGEQRPTIQCWAVSTRRDTQGGRASTTFMLSQAVQDLAFETFGLDQAVCVPHLLGASHGRSNLF